MDLGTIGSLKSLPISTELRNKDLFRDMRVNMGQQAHAQFVLQCPSTYCQASRPSVLVSPVQLFATPWTVAHQNPGDFPSKNPGVSCHFLLQGIFPTQGWKPGLQYCRQIPYWLSHTGKPSSPSKPNVIKGPACQAGHTLRPVLSCRTGKVLTGRTLITTQVYLKKKKKKNSLSLWMLSSPSLGR